MTRMPVSGTTIASLRKSQADLQRALGELGVHDQFDSVALADLYGKLQIIVGKWLAARSSIEVSPIAKALLTTAENLNDASTVLSGLEPGLRSNHEITVASAVMESLALEPEVHSRSKARELISIFQKEAARMAHVCMVAHVALPNQPGARGRRTFDWYDDFTALLHEIADKAGVQPTLWKNRVDQARSGWLLDAALALEPFLHKHMGSPSTEACGKRLERSIARLQKPARQKSRSPD